MLSLRLMYMMFTSVRCSNLCCSTHASLCSHEFVFRRLIDVLMFRIPFMITRAPRRVFTLSPCQVNSDALKAPRLHRWLLESSASLLTVIRRIVVASTHLASKEFRYGDRWHHDGRGFDRGRHDEIFFHFLFVCEAASRQFNSFVGRDRRNR